MSFVLALSKCLKISEKSFIKSLNTFKGLPHRYEVFLKKRILFLLTTPKATSFQSSKLALQNSKNIFWIVGGLPKKNDKIKLNDIKNNIIKSYIIGKKIQISLKNKLRIE